MKVEASGLRNIIFGNMGSVQPIHLRAVGLGPYVGPPFDRRNPVTSEWIGVVGSVAFSAGERPRWYPIRSSITSTAVRTSTDSTGVARLGSLER